jgi:hypothetical protein
LASVAPVKSRSEFAIIATRLPHEEGRTIEEGRRAMTALQDWLSLRPVDQSTIMEMVRRPLRAVMSTPDVEERPELKLISPGVERC